MNALRKSASVLALAGATALGSAGCLDQTGDRAEDEATELATIGAADEARGADVADEKTGESQDHQFWGFNPWWGGAWGFRPWWGWGGWGVRPWGFYPWWGGAWGVRPWWGWGGWGW